MLLRRIKEENEEGGFEGSEAGLHPWPRQRLAMESRRDISDAKTEIKTDVEIEFCRG